MCLKLYFCGCVVYDLTNIYTNYGYQEMTFNELTVAILHMLMEYSLEK